MPTESNAPNATDTPEKRLAKTIVFVHGIGNKPPPEVLKLQWDRALFGFDLGERSRMAYWVNRDLHGPPLGNGLDPDEVAALAPKAVAGGFGTKDLRQARPGPKMGANEAAAMERLRKQLAVPADPGAGYGTKVLPLPGFARNWITEAVTGWFLEDVHDFLFVEARRRTMRESLIARLRTGGGPFVVIAHSQGTMIAYDVLSNWSGPPIEVPLFVTLGSPLGLAEVEDQLERFTQQKQLATPALVQRWENFVAHWDPVALDQKLNNDHAANANGVKVQDHAVTNPVQSNPHSGIGYLSLKAVRSVVLEAIQKPLFQPVAEFTVAKNLNREMTAADDEVRHPVLIELQDQKPLPHLHCLTDGLAKEAASGFLSLAESRQSVVNWIREQRIIANGRQPNPAALTDAQRQQIDDELELEALHAYVSAKLTRTEVERLSATLRNAAVFRIFKNSSKRLHLRGSVQTVQAHTAHLGYGAQGQDVVWAVLDSGVDWGHPHFADPAGNPTSIARVFECSKRSDEPVEVEDFTKTTGGPGKDGWDGNGHGTHVAGIIAGQHEKLGIEAIAPQTRLWCYKVLNDDGQGGDSKIIKALDHIYTVNENSPQLSIHGVNLSLGGPFEAEVFGCGDTPLCKCLRKLWRQGVVVVVSAGNEGIVDVPGVGSLNMDLSIGDPANLDECIVVGSVHATKPHLYGVSYFSSRGPTADGRAKPDVVAPGEKILSCLAGGRGATEEALYTRMSGTSMAAPHVSGVAACFLSARPEFKGFPDKVKRHLLSQATDLERDRMHQGAGLVNLVKMLLNT
ncbi:MAG: S8 family peptidase [Verrucomicrobiota bacterium]